MFLQTVLGGGQRSCQMCCSVRQPGASFMTFWNLGTWNKDRICWNSGRNVTYSWLMLRSQSTIVKKGSMKEKQGEKGHEYSYHYNDTEATCRLTGEQNYSRIYAQCCKVNLYSQKKNPRTARNLPAPHLSLGIRVPAIHIKGGSMGWSILGSCNKNSKPPMKWNFNVNLTDSLWQYICVHMAFVQLIPCLQCYLEKL